MARTIDENRELQEYIFNCDYREPPADLWPSKFPDLAGAQWNALHDWFQANTKDADDAVLVFIADRANVSIGEAYIATDGWAKVGGEPA